MNAGLAKDVREGVDMWLAPLSVEQYHRMIENGILEDGEPIELIEGALLYKDRRDDTGAIMTHGAKHLRALNKLMALLSHWVANRHAFLQAQSPIVIGENSEPEPDCCLVRGTPDDFAECVPRAADVLAVFEVALSSLQSDRQTKRRLYAGAGIPHYVILNLRDKVIEAFSEPVISESRYRTQSEFRTTDPAQLSLGASGLLSFSANDLL